MSWEDGEVRARVARVDRLLSELESAPDSAEGRKAIAAVEGLVGLYGEALERVLRHAASSPAVQQTLLSDELLAQLLLAHDLHPLSLQERVDAALEQARSSLKPQGAEVEPLGIDQGAVRVQLRRTGGCKSSAAAIRLALEDAIRRAAPEVERVEVEEAVIQPRTVISVESLLASRPRRPTVVPQ
jgi:Fe-S cluster biogenesis protein NfuA